MCVSAISMTYGKWKKELMLTESYTWLREDVGRLDIFIIGRGLESGRIWRVEDILNAATFVAVRHAWRCYVGDGDPKNCRILRRRSVPSPKMHRAPVFSCSINVSDVEAVLALAGTNAEPRKCMNRETDTPGHWWRLERQIEPISSSWSAQRGRG